MANVDEITTLNIDNETYNVVDLSDAVQKMVEIFNGWNVKEAEATDALMMVKAAKADLSRQIILQVRADNEAAGAGAGTPEAEAPAADASNDEAAE